MINLMSIETRLIHTHTDLYQKHCLIISIHLSLCLGLAHLNCYDINHFLIYSQKLFLRAYEQGSLYLLSDTIALGKDRSEFILESVLKLLCVLTLKK